MAKSVRGKKWLPAVLAFILTLLVLVSNLNNDTDWGDDNAAYITQGIALAEGRLDEQAHLNPFLHPTPLPKEADGTLIYAMGYPVILSLVYRLAGFDRETFSTLFLYKLPSVLAMAGCAAILYVFNRRRLPAWLSFLFSVLFCINPLMLNLVDSMYSDSVFLFFLLLSFNMTEAFLDAFEEEKAGKAVFLGILLGLSMGMVAYVRLSGFAYCIAIALMCLLRLRKTPPRGRRVLTALLPWVVLAVFMLIFNGLLFPKATSNLSDYSQTSLRMILSNIWHYASTTIGWLSKLFGQWIPRPVRLIIGGIAAVFFLLGLWTASRKEIPYFFFLAGTYIGVILLPYTQGLRYCYPVLHIILLYVGYGLLALGERLQKRETRSCSVLKCACLVCVWILFAVNVATSCSGSFFGMLRGEGPPVREEPSPFSVECTEMYRYIREKIPGECEVTFYKPRLLYLVTQRMSFKMGVNGHELSQADYYLKRTDITVDEETPELLKFDGSLRELYSSGCLTLYSVDDGVKPDA